MTRVKTHKMVRAASSGIKGRHAHGVNSYSYLCLNPYLSVDTKKYGLLQSMGFGRAHPRAIFLGCRTWYYVLNDYILSKYNNYEVK